MAIKIIPTTRLTEGFWVVFSEFRKVGGLLVRLGMAAEVATPKIVGREAELLELGLVVEVIGLGVDEVEDFTEDEFEGEGVGV